MALSARKTAVKFDIPRRTIRNWIEVRDAILAGSEKQRALRKGRGGIVPFSDDLVMFMKDTRREEKVLSTIWMQFIRAQRG